MLNQPLRELRSLYAHFRPRSSSKRVMPEPARTTTSAKYTGRPSARVTALAPIQIDAVSRPLDPWVGPPTLSGAAA